MSGKKEPKKSRLERLRKLVAYHQRLYHEEDAPEISDEAYDALARELKTLEREAGGQERRVSETVGGAPGEAFAKITHAVRQWSLDNVFSASELANWEERLKRLLQKEGVVEPLSYVVEHKLDGLKLIAEYEKGDLVRAATRGDGRVGEDVTHTARAIRSLPHRLAAAVDLICVGEVLMLRRDFEALNRRRKAAGEALFANPRNAAAGSLRQLDPKVTQGRHLSFIAYDIDRFAAARRDLHPPASQWDELKLLRTLGLPVSEHAARAATLEEVVAYFERWQKKRASLPYDLDGVVVKVDSLSLQRALGYTAQAPRFGVAYKFPAVETTTIVEAIDLHVGRTGVVTPVARLRPVLIGGSTVARATLHNEDQIKRLDVRAGDTVIVRKAGDIIPEVVSVVLPLRPPEARPYRFPKRVAGCGGDGRIVRFPGEAAYRCVSLDSPLVLRRRLYHFVSKAAFNIDGLGPRIIDALLERNLISTAADLFTLTKEDFLSLPKFKDKAAKNAADAIATARRVSLPRLIFALGIDGVGVETARRLAERFGTVSRLRLASRAELEAIDGIGSGITDAIIAWQKNRAAQAALDALLAHLLVEAIGTSAPAASARLSGQTFVFTGTLKGLAREEAKELVRRLGGRVANNVSKKTSAVVVGEAPGSKAKDAKRFGVRILSEAEFLTVIA
jgi:DNA ligase (NAD+)